MKFMIRWVLPTIIPMIMNALIMVLMKLSQDSDSNVDDKLLQVIVAEQDNITVLILNEARKLI